MVNCLMTPKPDGRGNMILLRTLSNAAAELISGALRQAQIQLNLEDRFAVLVDNQQRTRTLQEAVPATLLDQAKIWSGKTDFQIKLYSDLADIPCVLILCEKGNGPM